jgi:SAM-dependent methyltransferase
VNDRYWWDNSLGDEVDRLRLLEVIADPRSIRLLNRIGVRAGWKCAELGAGAGSMALWIAEEVGDSGSALPVDRNITLLEPLRSRLNVEIMESSLEDLDLEPASLDLIHTRNVLMHIEDADTVIAKLVQSLRPGGHILLEEADYYSVAGSTSAAFREVVTPMVASWTWARTMPNTIARLLVENIDVEVDATMLQGGSAQAAFWNHTLRSLESRLMEPDQSGSGGVSRASFNEALQLLTDSQFWTPFATVVCVTAQRV